MLVNLVRAMVYVPLTGKRRYQWMITYWKTEGGVESEHVLSAERSCLTHVEAQIGMLAELNRLLKP